MLENLNTRTKNIVSGILRGESVSIAGNSFDAFETQECLLLYVIANNLATLAPLGGGNLADTIVELLKTAELPESETESDADPNNGHDTLWKIANISAFSFRGLAPAGQVWEYDFICESHLLYGPNGCGKSSLLGAIAWCLTGHIFRDDCAPDHPADIDVFTTGASPRKTDSRPDALSLLNESGESVSAASVYWVKIQLKGTDTAGTEREMWIERNSENGLSMSLNNSDWSKISDLTSVGISELDTELRVLMPARVPHLQFGENPDLVRLFSQIIGLDELASIASIADGVSRALRAGATRVENNELLAQAQRIEAALSDIKEAATDEIESWPEFVKVIGDLRTLDEVKEFGEKSKQGIASWREQLVRDIGLSMPAREDAGFSEFESQLAQLSGRVQAGIDRLSMPVNELFSTSLGSDFSTKSKVDEKVKQLEQFTSRAKEKVGDRLRWARKEQADARANLMLIASGFTTEENSCPVCTQNLNAVPTVRDELLELKPYSQYSHLKKSIEDLERELISDLNSIVEQTDRVDSETSLDQRVVQDWQKIKEASFTGLLQTIADTFDEKIEQVAASATCPVDRSSESICGEFEADFSGAFAALSIELESARKYLSIASAFHRESAQLKESLSELLSSKSEPESLLQVLARGNVAGEQLQVLDAICKDARTLWDAQKKHGELLTQIEKARETAQNATVIKSLSQVVSSETIRLIEEVEPQTKTNFTRLYNNDILEFDMLTTGHAANPGIKKQINVYMKSGTERVPIGPFTNAGRLRALVLSFVFALMGRSKNTLGVLILDDPALSLDDEHKARFVDCLVQPMLDINQVIAATHYESFFKTAEQVFKTFRCLQMPPRRTTQDHVTFVPADLLKRLEASISSNSGSWREHGLNLRRWAERTLRTLSGFCPEPFFVWNNIPGSVDAYDRIEDPRIATARRDRIVMDLRSAIFIRIMHTCAHDEEPTETEVRDGLELLKKCEREAVEHEVVRLKGLYNHASLGRSIDPRPNLNLLSFEGSTAVKQMPIIGEAAAASAGVGINWIDEETVSILPFHAIRVTSDVLAPIAMNGDIILLDSEDIPPNDSDLVAVQLEDGRRLIRRFWIRDHLPYFESVNATSPSSPIVVANGEHLLRKIVGVLFYRHVAVDTSGANGEWDDVGEARKLLIGLSGVRCKGTSMEPIARNNQTVLIGRESAFDSLQSGELACVDAEVIEAVIKRCFVKDKEWILNSVNPETIETPILLPRENIRHVYRVKGVLFDPV